MLIFPSLISSPLLNLEKTLQNLNSECDGFHIDVMDGHFVPNITWGPAFVNAIKAVSKKPLQIHLMVSNPEQWLDTMILDENDSYIFHQEAFDDTKRTLELIQRIHDKGYKAGIAINPHTPIEAIKNILHVCDSVLIMSVYPGFSGQIFISEVMQKIDPLLEIKRHQGHTFHVGLDGGINETNIALLSAKNIDSIAAAAGIFSKPDPIQALKNLYKLCSR